MRNEMTAVVAHKGGQRGGEPDEVQARSMLVVTLRRLRRSHTAIVGLTIVVLLLLVAALADVLAPYSPRKPPIVWRSPVGATP